MDDFSAPSFSLGLDLDIADLPTEDEQEQEKEEEERPPTLLDPSSVAEPPSFELSLDQEFVDAEMAYFNESFFCDHVEETPVPALNRLRRGPVPRYCGSPSPVDHYPLNDSGGERKDDSLPLDDDIEEFSSQEDNPSRANYSSVRSHFTGSTSKISLQNHGVRTSRSKAKLVVPKISPASDGMTSTVSHESGHKRLFQASNISPVRKIFLLSSDSDDASSEDECKYNKVGDRHQNPITENGQHRSFRYGKTQEVSLWKDVDLNKNINLATPVLDQFCEDYFKSITNPKSGRDINRDTSLTNLGVAGATELVNDVVENDHQKNTIGSTQKCNLSNAEPPSFRYFYHDDIRIQELVRQRLCHFAPLGAEVHGENVNYMNQFDTRDVSRATKTCKRGLAESSKKGKKAKNGTPKVPSDVSHVSGDWTSTRNSSTIPKDAGKRRVHADGRTGHWFTDQDGMKVYVTKNGQELKGQLAYRQYRKDSGAPFRKSRKKAASKRKKK